MTPRIDVDFLTMPVTPEAIAEAIRDTGHSCFPVVNGDLDEVEGVLFVNDLFRSTTAKRAIGVSLPTADEIARKIRRRFMLPETMDLLESLSEMREQRRTFALVLDEHGGVAGVVSIRDILEQLVGDLNDEFDEDEEPTIVRIRQDRWLVDGQTHVDEVEEALGIDDPRRRVRHHRRIHPRPRRRDPCGRHDLHLRATGRFACNRSRRRRISEIVIEYHNPGRSRRCRRSCELVVAVRAPTRIIGLRGNSLRAVAQLGSALRSGRRGPGFKSRQPDHQRSTR